MPGDTVARHVKIQKSILTMSMQKRQIWPNAFNIGCGITLSPRMATSFEIPIELCRKYQLTK